MPKTRFECQNCGYEEELTEAQLAERQQAGEENICPKCGADVSAPEHAANNGGVTDAAGEAGAAGESASANAAEKSGRGEKAEAVKEAAEAAKTKLKQAFDAGRSDPTILTRTIDVIMQKLSGLINVSGSGSCTSLSMKLGQYATLVFAVFSLAMGVILMVRMLSFTPLLQGLFLFLATVLAQYCATKLFPLLDDVTAKCQSTLSGQAVVDVQAVLALAGALFSATMIAHTVLTLGGIGQILIWCGLTAFCLILTVVLLNPEDLNAKVNAKSGITEQALGIAAYQAKAMARMAVFTYGILGTMAACGLGWNMIKTIFLGSRMDPVLLAGYACVYLVLVFSPVFIYVSTLMTFVIIDLVRHMAGIKK